MEIEGIGNWEWVMGKDLELLNSWTGDDSVKAERETLGVNPEWKRDRVTIGVTGKRETGFPSDRRPIPFWNGCNAGLRFC